MIHVKAQDGKAYYLKRRLLPWRWKSKELVGDWWPGDGGVAGDMAAVGSRNSGSSGGSSDGGLFEGLADEAAFLVVAIGAIILAVLLLPVLVITGLLVVELLALLLLFPLFYFLRGWLLAWPIEVWRAQELVEVHKVKGHRRSLQFMRELASHYEEGTPHP